MQSNPQPSIQTVLSLTPNPGPYSGVLTYSQVNMALIGDATFGQSSSSGGWQVVDRPKMAAAIQWFDRAPWTLSFEAYLDKTRTEGGQFLGPAPVTPGSGTIAQPASANNVEDYCAQLKLWMDPIPGQLQPPVLTISGPVPEASWMPGGNIQAWVLYNVEFAEAIRDLQTGFRTLQKVKITLYEYLPPLNDMYLNFNLTPVNAVMKGSGGSGNTTAASNKITWVWAAVGKKEDLSAFVDRHFKSQKNYELIRKHNKIKAGNTSAPGPYNQNANHKLQIPKAT